MATRREAPPSEPEAAHDMQMNGFGHGPVIEPPIAPTSLVEAPQEVAIELRGMEEFGLQRNWVSFEAQRGKLVCRALGSEYEEFSAIVLESRVVRAMKDDDGNILCSAIDLKMADTGRPGRICETCEDRHAGCQPRWWIAWQELETGCIFAHTLSQTGSMNFNRYANRLLQEKLYPSQVITRIFVEEAHRQKTNTLYRRIQFERLYT